MHRLESTQNASSESFSRSSNLTEQASTLLSERYSTQTGGRRELAATSIDLASNVYGSAEKAGSCMRADDACSWRPNESSNSAQSRNWRSQREAQRDKPVEMQDGKYEIKPGDTMNDVSKRFLKDLGVENPSAKEIDGLSKMIADQNKEQHSILKCNPNLIRPGMKLEMPSIDSVSRLSPKGDVFGSMTPDIIPPSSKWSESEGLNRDDNNVAGPPQDLFEAKPPYVEDLPFREPGRILEIKLPGQIMNGIGNVSPNECRREDGLTNLPEQFRSPLGMLDSLDNGFYNDAIQLPFNFRKDQPGQFMNLPFRPGEDSPGKIMNLPFRPGEDAPGKLMTLENRITNPTSKNGSNDSTQHFLKRMLDHVPLPEVMLV
ncbi:MAG: hypothetical protein C0469_14675 [Cyanobacteria bacterium DS2.3.42]|nr:hypothetical protein [Cyanobacteria bacterium DS2.3.42]